MNNRAPRRDGGVSRRAAILLTIAAIGVVAVVLTIGLGAGQASPSPGSRATPALGDLSLVTIPPAPNSTPSSPPAQTSSALSSGSPGLAPTSAASLPGEIRANRIRIARLGIDLAIIEGDGIDAPIGKAAHYPGSAWPGGGSNIYIYGHAREGMFITLWQARKGDTIDLDLSDGTTRAYVVTRVVPRVPWNAIRYLEPTKTEQLTLQTSTSYYSTAPRFVVIAVPAS